MGCAWPALLGSADGSDWPAAARCGLSLLACCGAGWARHRPVELGSCLHCFLRAGSARVRGRGGPGEQFARPAEGLACSLLSVPLAGVAAQYVKAGFAGDNFPSAMFPAMVGRPMMRTDAVGDSELKVRSW